MGTNVGRMVLSAPCRNFRQLEYESHQEFSQYRSGNTELFSIGFECVAEFFKTINYEIDDE